MRPSIEHAYEQLDPRLQLANTPLPQSATSGLHPISSYQMAPPQWTSDCTLLLDVLIYRPQNYGGLSWPSWLTTSGRSHSARFHSYKKTVVEVFVQIYISIFRLLCLVLPSTLGGRGIMFCGRSFVRCPSICL